MSDGSANRLAPPDDAIADVDQYLEFTSWLPDEAKANVRRYMDPLTGDSRSFVYDNHVVLAEIHHVCMQIGRIPTSDDFEGHGQISLATYRDRFGTFPRAVEAAGLEPKFKSTQEKIRYQSRYEELVNPEEHHPFGD